MQEHLSDEEVRAYWLHQIDKERLPIVSDHLSQCHDCRALLATSEQALQIGRQWYRSLASVEDLHLTYDDLEEYADTGEIGEAELMHHLEVCEDCSTLGRQMRQRVLTLQRQGLYRAPHLRESPSVVQTVESAAPDPLAVEFQRSEIPSWWERLSGLGTSWVAALTIAGICLAAYFGWQLINGRPGSAVRKQEIETKLPVEKRVSPVFPPKIQQLPSNAQSKSPISLLPIPAIVLVSVVRGSTPTETPFHIPKNAPKVELKFSIGTDEPYDTYRVVIYRDGREILNQPHVGAQNSGNLRVVTVVIPVAPGVQQLDATVFGISSDVTETAIKDYEFTVSK